MSAREGYGDDVGTMLKVEMEREGEGGEAVRLGSDREEAAVCRRAVNMPPNPPYFFVELGGAGPHSRMAMRSGVEGILMGDGEVMLLMR